MSRVLWKGDLRAVGRPVRRAVLAGAARREPDRCAPVRSGPVGLGEATPEGLERDVRAVGRERRITVAHTVVRQHRLAGAVRGVGQLPLPREKRRSRQAGRDAWMDEKQKRRRRPPRYRSRRGPIASPTRRLVIALDAASGLASTAAGGRVPPWREQRASLGSVGTHRTRGAGTRGTLVPHRTAFLGGIAVRHGPAQSAGQVRNHGRERGHQGLESSAAHQMLTSPREGDRGNAVGTS